MTKLSVNIAGLKLRNPVMLAAGILGMSYRTLKRVYESGAGAVVTKSIGLKPRTGFKNPTLIEVECGLLNAMGLPNPGVDYFAEEISKLKKCRVKVIASIYGFTTQEYVIVAKKVWEAGADAIEVNCSCPHVKEVGLVGQNPKLVMRITKAIKNAVDIPVFVKLTPNVTDITLIAKAVEEAGADAVTAINTVSGMAVNIETEKPILAAIHGGLSGPAIKPIALKAVYQIYRTVKIPVIGCGGVTNWRDAVEFMLKTK